MTPQQLYELLDKAGFEYDVVDIFEGVRVLRIEVEDVDEEDDQ